MLKLLGLFVVFITSTNYCFAESTNCGLRELDSRMTPIVGLFGLKELKFPENEQGFFFNKIFNLLALISY
jgi:hypothetical protein